MKEVEDQFYVYSVLCIEITDIIFFTFWFKVVNSVCCLYEREHATMCVQAHLLTGVCGLCPYIGLLKTEAYSGFQT